MLGSPAPAPTSMPCRTVGVSKVAGRAATAGAAGAGALVEVSVVPTQPASGRTSNARARKARIRRAGGGRRLGLAATGAVAGHGPLFVSQLVRPSGAPAQSGTA